MDPFHGVLIAAAILVLFLIFVALPLVFLRYFFFFSAGGVAGAPAPRGIGTELLGSLPVTVYRAEGHVGVLECAVCLAGLQDGERARFLPRCGHGFHAGCVDVWLASRSTCPLCRVTVVGNGKLDALTSPSLHPAPAEPANYARNLPLMPRILDQATLRPCHGSGAGDWYSGVKDGGGDRKRPRCPSDATSPSLRAWPG